MYGYEYPYANFHDINLDWVLEKVRALEAAAQEGQGTAKEVKTTVGKRMYGNAYPYTNFHDINLDWVMGKTKECVEKVAAIEPVAQEAQDTAKAAKTTAEAAKAESATAAQTAANSATEAAAAKATADGIDAKATQALEKAGNAETKATSAKEVSVVAKQLAMEATTTAQNAATSAAAAQTAAESAQASAAAAAADATAAAGSVSEFDQRITDAQNTANQAKISAFGANQAAADAQDTADTNAVAIRDIQTKLGGIAKSYNIAVGTTWADYNGQIVKQEITVEGLVPGVVNLFDLDIPTEQLENAISFDMEWDKILKKEAQIGKVILYAESATQLPINVVLYVITNG